MSESLAPVDLLLLWHHHQPDYRRPSDGRSVLPWARLHVTKDYLDMARHVERQPGLRMTFNLVPSLVDQIEAMARGEPDELLELIARPIAALSAEERVIVMARSVQVPSHAVDRWPALRALRGQVLPLLARPAGGRGRDRSTPLGEAELLALEIWFLLAWLDPMFHDEPEAARALAEHPRWSERHRDDLLALQRRIAGLVIPAYRALAERGQVELSASPYHHPILPLLVDLTSARRARPDLQLPSVPLAAPEDAERQMSRALVRHAVVFGKPAAGMWPSEGSVSPEVASLAARLGVRWLASDEEVLWRSLDPAAHDRGALYRPWRFQTESGEVALFFRDHALSDRIGFVYQRWDAREAVADFIGQLRRIARDHRGEPAPLVSVILDGENCWEQYPDDGDRFLSALYQALAEATDIRTRTPSEVLTEWRSNGRTIGALPRLHSGSWIDADFHIWIGHPEKNRAWDQLARARAALVAAGVTPASAPAAWEALARAEGSDWFWWFGEDHQTGDRAVFDRLFRELVSAAYSSAGLTPPAPLRLPIVRPDATSASRQPPVGFVTPTIDGRRTAFYEWHAAGHCAVGAGSAMHRGEPLVRDLYYGFDAQCFYLRLDFASGMPPGEALDLRLDLVEPRPVRLRVARLAAGERPVLLAAAGEDERPLDQARCVVGPLLELAVPFANLGAAPGELIALLVQTLRDGRPVESYPGEEGLTFVVPGPDFEASMWSA
jgi:alpha-amylase/alpha-mannosidase (GH57 family)